MSNTFRHKAVHATSMVAGLTLCIAAVYYIVLAATSWHAVVNVPQYLLESDFLDARRLALIKMLPYLIKATGLVFAVLVWRIIASLIISSPTNVNSNRYEVI